MPFFKFFKNEIFTNRKYCYKNDCILKQNGDIVVVEDLPVDAFAQSKIDENIAVLLEERDAVSELLGS